ncbi:MAG TPA: hypothetical protein VMM82_13735, partial [Spirochaetia bacterium]|nr:hypothetical protein [Spirochaetia bacterium]
MKSGLDQSVADLVHGFVLEKSAHEAPPHSFSEDSFWKGLRGMGTELWLDTGDMDAASGIWTREFSA